MKKGLSIILVFALTASLAGILGACGKKPAEDSTETSTETAANPYREMMSDLFGDFEDESYSYVERTTDEHYDEEYEALTLPSANPAGVTNNTATTKPNNIRETTTKPFMFTTPAQQPTTSKNNNAATTKPGQTTTKPASVQTTASDTTSMTDAIPETNVAFGGSVQIPTKMPRPQVTYLDKYVIGIMSGTSYTATTEMRADGVAVPMTYYVDGDNNAVKLRVTQMLAGEMDMPNLMGLDEIRLITKGAGKNSHIYLAWAGGYLEMEGEGIDDIKDMMGDMQASQDINSLLMVDRLEYCGVVSGVGYVCETYEIPEENLAYCFYFTSNGISRWEVIDMSTKEVVETMVISLKSGADKSAFAVSGKKYTMSEFENMFAGLAQ